MSTVDYRCADLLHLPAEWQAGFDLVVEISTVQALPPQHHRAAIDAVRSLVAPGGRLLVIGRVPEPAGSGPPPWPLSGTEIESFAADNVRPVAIEQIPAQPPGRPRWRAEFARH
jgi:hypothetical protein